MILLLLCMTIVLLLVVYLLIPSRITKINRLIPGPVGYPIVGNLFQFRDLVASIDKNYQIYGPVYRIRLGSMETVVISGNQALEESFISKRFIFSDRFVRNSRKFSKGIDIIHSNGELNQILRNVYTSAMGTRKIKQCQTEIQLQVNEMIDTLYESRDTTNNITCNIPTKLKSSMLSIIIYLIFGKNESDESLKNEFISTIKIYFNSTGKLTISDFIPILLPFDIIDLKMSGLINDYKIISNFVESNIQSQLKIMEKDGATKVDRDDKEEKEQVDESEGGNNKEWEPLMNAYLKKYLNGEIEYESVLRACINLLFAGSDTISITLSFLIVSLINNPEVQEKVYNEFKSSNVKISFSDRLKYPYTCAMIKEVHRKFAIAPLSEPHIVNEDVELFGYKIAKGTQIIQNIYSTSLSSDFWSDPFKFNPDRFLNNSSPTPTITNFGLGPRSCLGRNFAEFVIFTSVVTLFKKYKFTNSSNVPISEIGEFGLVTNCSNFNTIIEKRL